MGDAVILIHGLGLKGQGASMRLLATRLRRAGFIAVCLDYPAYRMSASDALAHLKPRVAATVQRYGRCHIVGHSLGGVLAAELADTIPEPLRGKVVQLGSPNLGSPLAELALRISPVRRALGPVLSDLSRHELTREHTQVAAVAGLTSWGPAAKLPGPLREAFADESDGKVSVVSALAGASEKAIVPVGHAFLPTSRRVAKAVISYLEEGRFPEELRV